MQTKLTTKLFIQSKMYEYIKQKRKSYIRLEFGNEWIREVHNYDYHILCNSIEIKETASAL